MSDALQDPFGWVGQVIDGKYRVDELIGEGGFGVVYRAFHTGLQSTVAFKCLKVPAALHSQDRERFLETFFQEGRLLHQLSRAHAGIAQALDVGEADSPSGTWTPYLVLEWLDGRPLDEELDARRQAGTPPMSIDEAVELLSPAALALAEAHEQSIVHRDIKPANLFLTRIRDRTTLKVLDFGIAKVLAETASVTAMLEATGGSIKAFTPQYGAPEQFDSRHGATGPWTDVFALALVVVELVTGRPALEGQDTIQLMIKATHPDERPTPSQLGMPISAAVEKVLRRALAVEPRDRYLSAGELWKALKGSLFASSPTMIDETGASLSCPLPTPIVVSSPAAAPPSAVSAATAPAGGPAPPTAPAGGVPGEPAVSTMPAAGVAAAAPGSVGGTPPTAPPAVAPSTTTPQIAPIQPTPQHASQRRSGRGVWIAILAVVVVAAAAAGGFVLWRRAVADDDDDSGSSKRRSAKASDRAEGPDGHGKGKLAAVPDRKVPEGLTPDAAVWVPGFKVQGAKKSGGRNWLDARTICARQGRELCSEVQWLRACAEDPKVGQVAAWTVSISGAAGFVVRGGGGCGRRGVMTGAVRDPKRGALCCTRAVGIRSSDDQLAFRRATALRIVTVETLVAKGSAVLFAAQLADPVDFYGKRLGRKAAGLAVSKQLRRWPDLWLAHDTCRVSLQRRGNPDKDTWTADCDTTTFRDGKVAGTVTHYVFGGSQKKLQHLSTPKIVRNWAKP